MSIRISLTVCLLILAGALGAQDAAPTAGASEEAERSSAPRVTRTPSGITVIRGTTSQAPQPKEEPAAAADQDASATGEDAAAEKAPASSGVDRKSSRTVEYEYDANGRRVRKRTSTQQTERGKEGSSVVSLETVNGRRVPYLEQEEKVISSGRGTEVREQRTQRYDATGRPTHQEVVRIEEKRAADGSVVTTSTLYRETLNGRMEPIERVTKRSKEAGSTKTTTTVTEGMNINGGFGAIRRVEEVERKQGESRASVERTESVATPGGRLSVAAREESVMLKKGNVLTTETTRFEKNPVAGELTQKSRTVGRMVEKADGSTSETVETYGFQAEGGAFNLNASKMVLQEVVERAMNLGANGEKVERTSVKSRDPAEPSRFAPAEVSRKVTRPSADGETVRTEVFEQGPNGRMRAVGLTVEQVQK